MREEVNSQAILTPPTFGSEINDGAEGIRAVPRAACCLCDSLGISLYENLNDRLFGAPGKWHLKQCPNPICGLVWLDPMPHRDDIGKAYADYYTHSKAEPPKNSWLLKLFLAARRGYLENKYGYFENSFNPGDRLAGCLSYLHPGRRAVFDFNVMWLHAAGKGRLLDVGCGSGQLLRFMADLGWEVTGVDFDAKAASHAASRGIEIHVGPLETHSFPAEQFDAVTMSHFIEHVHDPIGVIGECRRILKPGGRLVMVTPNVESLGHRLYRADWMHLDPPRHLHLFNRATIRRITAAAGFERMEVRTSLRDAYGMFLGSRSIRRTGHYDMTAPQPRGARLWARGAELVEWLTLKFDSTAGEDLVLIAKKL